MQAMSCGCHAEAAASQQNFAEQLQELQQQSQAATDACPTAEQYNQVSYVPAPLTSTVS